MNIYTLIYAVDTDSAKIKSVINSCKEPAQLLTTLNWLSNIRTKWEYSSRFLLPGESLLYRSHINEQYNNLLDLINDNLRCG